MTTTPDRVAAWRRPRGRRPDPRFDRLDHKDPRSRTYDVADTLGESEGDLRSRRWHCAIRLDQGATGACVGFAWAHELAAEPDPVPGIDADVAREQIYYAAQRRDRFPGGAWPGALPFAEGTSVLAAAAVVRDLGHVTEYRWAFDVLDLVLAVGHLGPAVFGCRWYEAMQEPDAEGFVRPEGAYLGKHCVLVTGVDVVRDECGRLDRSATTVVLVNSFGSDWGEDGTARLRLTDLEQLWDGAETCIPLTRSGRRLRAGETP